MPISNIVAPASLQIMPLRTCIIYLPNDPNFNRATMLPR